MKRKIFFHSLYFAMVILAITQSVFGSDSQVSAKQEHEFRQKQARTRSIEQARHQILLQLTPNADLAVIQKKFPLYLHVSEVQGPLVILRSERVVSSADLKQLRKIPGIANVEADSPVQAHGAATGCSDSNTISALTLPALPAFLQNCSTAEICRNSGKSKLWAQERVDADLMKEELQRIGIQPGTVKVAVIDTGFDLQANGARMASPSLAVKKGHEKAGEPSIDDGGHGTMVASLIGGKDGIGIAPQAKLTVYRVTEPYAEGSTSDASLKLSLEKACAEGNEIINLSWGGLADELGIVLDEKTEKAFADHLAARGCLVVKAAGNSAFRKRDSSSENPDGAYLRVGAISDSGNLSTFSTVGEVYAPGSGVFVLESTQIPSDERASNEDVCGTSTGRFASGTSFSAPITTAIGAQVIAVLKTGSKYATLPGPERVKLVDRILNASQTAGSINALRAVLIAEQWVQKKSVKIPTAQMLSQSLRQSASCDTPRVKCTCTANCTELQSCVENSRRKIALCDGIDAATLSDLMEVQIAAGNLESAAGLLHYFTPATATDKNKEDMATSARDLWNAYLNRWSSQRFHPKYDPSINLRAYLDFDDADDAISTYIPIEKDKSQLKTVLNIMLKSYSLHTRLSESPSHGGDETLASFYGPLKSAALKMGLTDFKAFLGQAISDSLSSETAMVDNIVVFARILNRLAEDESFSSIKGDLFQMESGIFATINKNNFSFVDDDLDYLKPLLTRKRGAVIKIATAATESGNYQTIGAMQMVYLTKNPELLPKEVRDKFFMGILPQLARGTISWGFNDSEIATNISAILKTNLLTASAADKESFVHSYQDSVRSSPSYRFILSVFPETYFSSANEYNLQNLVDSNPLLSREFLFSLARQSALSIPKQPPQTNEIFQLERNTLIQGLLPFLVSDPNPNAKNPKNFTVAVVPDSLTQTDLKKSGAMGPLNIKNQSVPDILDSLLAFLLDDYRNANQTSKPEENFGRINWGLEPIHSILENKDARYLLPVDGQWRKSLQRLLTDADQNKSRYPESQILWLKQFIQ